MQQRDPQLHRGHRGRVKRRFTQEGLENFCDYEVFELLLFFSIPQKDVNELAHKLVNTFGSFFGVLNASYDELCSIDGVGENTATLIRLCREMAIRYLEAANKPGNNYMYSYDVMMDFFEPKFVGERDEKLYMLSLDSRHRYVNCTLLSTGDINSVSISTRNIVRQAMLDNARFVILAHNHPSALAYPSRADLECTTEVAKGLALINVVLETHFIYGKDGSFTNMAENSQYSHVFDSNWKNLK